MVLFILILSNLFGFGNGDFNLVSVSPKEMAFSRAILSAIGETAQTVYINPALIGNTGTSLHITSCYPFMGSYPVFSSADMLPFLNRISFSKEGEKRASFGTSLMFGLSSFNERDIDGQVLDKTFMGYYSLTAGFSLGLGKKIESNAINTNMEISKSHFYSKRIYPASFGVSITMLVSHYGSDVEYSPALNTGLLLQPHQMLDIGISIRNIGFSVDNGIIVINEIEANVGLSVNKNGFYTSIGVSRVGFSPIVGAIALGKDIYFGKYALSEIGFFISAQTCFENEPLPSFGGGLNILIEKSNLLYITLAAKTTISLGISSSLGLSFIF